MIDLRHWLAFVAASLLLAILPGPGVANIVGHAVNSGRRTAFAAIAGAVVGNLVAMSLSLAGVGALLAGHPRAGRLTGLAGAAYLVALGLAGVLRSGGTPATAGRVAPVAIPPRAAFAGSIAVSALNPKSMVFFVAFVPPFIVPDRSYLGQCLILIATFAGVVAGSDTLYALLALRVTGWLRSPATQAWVRRAGGVVLIAAGLVAAIVG